SVEAILRHLGLDRWYLGNLVPARLRVFAVQGMATLAAGGRLHRNRLLDLLRRHQGPLLACVTGLSPSLAAGGWLRRSAFDVGRVARRRPGGVGGVLVQALRELIDLVLQGLQPLLILLNQGQDCFLGSRGGLGPHVNREWRD